MRRVNSAVQEANNSLNITPATSTGTAPTFNSSLSTLPAMAGITAGPGISVPTKLPEINTQLEDVNGTLVEMYGNVNNISGGFNDIGRSVEQMGNAFSAFGSSGFGGLLSAVGSGIQAYTQLATATASAAAAQAALETPTIWGKLGALASFLGAWGNMVAQMKSIGSYAEGGIIDGQNYNDGITARVSSGEMIINEADQKRLYDTIHSGSVGGGGGSASITGEQIVIAVNNYGRRTNRGELVFAGRG